MEAWWEFKLALFLAPLDLGETLPILWWIRPIWVWIPLLSAWWTLEQLQDQRSIYAIFRFPLWMMLLLGFSWALSRLTIPHPPCQFLKIQEVMVPGHYFCVSYGGLPEINCFLLAGGVAYFWDNPLFQNQQGLRVLLAIPVFLSGIASILLVQAFFSDVLTGMVLGILLTFVVRKLRKRAAHVFN